VAPQSLAELWWDLLKQCIGLRKLVLRAAMLGKTERLASAASDLQKLEELDLGHNYLSDPIDLSDIVRLLPALKTLNLTGNHFKKRPEGIPQSIKILPFDI